MTREEFISQMGYRDDSPLRNEDSLDIRTGDNGIIDMTNTGIPLMANNRYLPPYSGHHQFEPNSIVTEHPALTVKGREGRAGSIGLPNSTHLMQHERLQDGTWIAFPKIFQDENGEWKNFEEINERDGWWENYQYALKHDEVYGPFENEADAARFAVDGTWKNPTMTPQGEYNQEGFVPYPPENSDQIQQPGEAKFGGSLPKAQTGEEIDLTQHMNTLIERISSPAFKDQVYAQHKNLNGYTPDWDWDAILTKQTKLIQEGLSSPSRTYDPNVMIPFDQDEIDAGDKEMVAGIQTQGDIGNIGGIKYNPERIKDDDADLVVLHELTHRINGLEKTELTPYINTIFSEDGTQRKNEGNINAIKESDYLQDMMRYGISYNPAVDDDWNDIHYPRSKYDYNWVGNNVGGYSDRENYLLKPHEGHAFKTVLQEELNSIGIHDFNSGVFDDAALLKLYNMTAKQFEGLSDSTQEYLRGLGIEEIIYPEGNIGKWVDDSSVEDKKNNPERRENIFQYMNEFWGDKKEGDPFEVTDDFGQELTISKYGGQQDDDEIQYDWKIATEKSIYPDGEYNWYNPADSYRYLTNEKETIPIPPPPPEDPESVKNKSYIPLSWDEYKIEKPLGTIEQFRRYIRNPKYKDWRMNIFSPYTNRTKKGWANKEYYRGLDEEGMGEVQEWLIEQGYDIKKDNGWGDETYNALNNYLLDNKLLNKEITTNPLLTDDLLITQQYIESDGKPKAGSNKGALGLVQAMPGAWKDAIQRGILPENADRTNIHHALVFQRYYMTGLMNAGFVKDGTSDNEKLARALSAYNWGRGNTPRFFNNINYVATNETIYEKDGTTIAKDANGNLERGFRNKVDKNGDPILVPETERRDPLDMDSWMTLLDSSKDNTRWTIPKETVDYINLIMYPDKYIEMYSKKQYESRIKSTKKFKDYKKKAKKFYSYKEGGSLNRTKQAIRKYKSGGELSGLTLKHLEEIGIIPQYKEGGITHDINDKESLLGIASKYNTTEGDINKYNNLIDSEPLYKGQVLNIPEPIVRTPLEIKKESHKLGDYGIFKNMTLDTQIKSYSNYINGDYIMFSEKLGKKLYDKLNRVYYDKARLLNMSVLDYMKSILS